jgi:lysophospholipase L1-like esterase
MLKKILLVVWGSLLSIICLEIGSYLLLRSSHLRNALQIIKPDAQLLWRNRSNLDHSFYATRVFTDSMGIRIYSKQGSSRHSSVTVLSLGASPTFGWGVEYEQTYSAQLEKLLNIRVINGGQIGFSSEQGRKMLPALLQRFHPQVVLIPYVINDVDHLRFVFDEFREDRQIMPISFGRYWITRILMQSSFYWLLQQLRPRQLSSIQRKQFLAKPARVSLSHYLENMESMATEVKKSGAKAIFLIMPVNLPHSDACKQQIDNFDALKRCLAVRCGDDGLQYNDALRLLAKKIDVSIVDVAPLLLQYSQQMFLFSKGDPIHPSEIGHQLIARKVAEVIKKDVQICKNR